MDQPLSMTRTEETLYERDYAAWAIEQAALLRDAAAGDASGLDWMNLAEEIEALAGRDRRELGSHIRTIAEHLMKLQASPASDPRLGWEQTVSHARADIEAILQQSPSLTGSVPDLVRRQVPVARRFAARALRGHGEGTAVLESLPDYTPEQITGDWWPD